MLGIDIICVGKLNERYFTQACDEYIKRFSPYAKLNVHEIPEIPVSSAGEIAPALSREEKKITEKIGKGAFVICMCIEGKGMSSVAFSKMISDAKCNGKSRLCFIIGGSNGLSEEIKKSADVRLSMSEMTFPHHLARVMLLEQIYRAFKIEEGSGYHK